MGAGTGGDVTETLCVSILYPLCQSPNGVLGHAAAKGLPVLSVLALPVEQSELSDISIQGQLLANAI